MRAWMILVLLPASTWEHGRMMEPPSRASAWRVGFPTPKNEDDNALYCGGFGVQHEQNGGRCGICGDPWDDYPRENEAPGGLYATGIITKTYTQGSIIPVVIDLTANHQGFFEFKICPNNDIWRDPGQGCFDRFVLRSGRKGGFKYPIYDYTTGLRILYVRLPENLTCEQCILQWTYKAGNNWGVCDNGTGALGCGPQETFRACSDIRIKPSAREGFIEPVRNSITSFSRDTEFSLREFEDYYDELFGEPGENNVDYIETQESIRQYEESLNRITERRRMELIKRKLILSQALKALHKMLMESKEKRKEEREREVDRTTWLISSKVEEGGVTTVLPWWTRTNSHGRRRRRRRRRS